MSITSFRFYFIINLKIISNEENVENWQRLQQLRKWPTIVGCQSAESKCQSAISMGGGICSGISIARITFLLATKKARFAIFVSTKLWPETAFEAEVFLGGTRKQAPDRKELPGQLFHNFRASKSVVHKIEQSPDLEALKLWKGRSGWARQHFTI